MQKRLDQLDGMRFIMALTIVFSHMEFLFSGIYHYSYGNFYYQYVRNSTVAVDYFFMLSGFGIFYSAVAKQSVQKVSTAWPLSFARGKIKKIYRPYVISLLITVPYMFYINLQNHSLVSTVVRNGALFCIDLSLLQSLFGTSMISHSFNSVGWFLSALFIAYLLCPLFVRMAASLLNKKTHYMIVILVDSILLLLLASTVGVLLDRKLKIGGFGEFDDFFYGSPYVRCFYVWIGMLVSVLYIKTKKMGTDLKSGIGENVFFVISLAYFFSRQTILDLTGNNLIIVRALDVVNAALILIMLAYGRGFVSKLVSNKRLVLLGRDAMYLYLFHYAADLYIPHLFLQKNIYFGQVTGLVEAALYWACALAVSFLAWKIGGRRTAEKKTIS